MRSPRPEPKRGEKWRPSLLLCHFRRLPRTGSKKAAVNVNQDHFPLLFFFFFFSSFLCFFIIKLLPVFPFFSFPSAPCAFSFFFTLCLWDPPAPCSDWNLHLTLEFIWFYWVLRRSLGFTRFYRVLLGFTGFTGFYWVLLGFTGFY